MAEVDKPLVTVTGISGYAGSQVALAFLQDGGFRVRGTVRDRNNAAKIQPLRECFGELFDQMELVEADLLDDASLIAAVAGAKFVVHVASPFTRSTEESELVTPAVEGTKSIMRACHANGVRRCVITSSCATVIYPFEEPEGLYTEETWSDVRNPKVMAYSKSKILAERAAWDFIAELPEAERFELVTILPSFILGPALRTESSISIDFCRTLLDGVAKEVVYRRLPCVDVRDLAVAHI